MTRDEHSGAGRRALLITKTDPAEPRDGGALRVSAVIAALRAAGWQVDVVAARTAAGRRRDDLPPVRSIRAVRAALAVGREAARIGSVSVARWVDPRVAARLGELRRTTRYGLVVVEFSQLLVYRPLLAGLPLLLDMHNLEGELLDNYATSAPSAARRLAARWEAARLHALEGPRGLSAVQGIVTVSERDAAAVASRVPGTPVRAASNGVADAAFAVTDHRSTPPTAVFIAHLGWQPNVDAARWLVEKVWPRVRSVVPDAQLQLIGRSPAASVRDLAGSTGVAVQADVESPLPYLARAAVATAPLLAAGGTRLKILEALATGTPVVATPLGAMGLEALEGSGLDVAETVPEFVDMLVDRLGATADAEPIRAAVDHYRWATALAPLTRLAATLALPEQEPRQAGGTETAAAPIDFELVLVNYRSRDQIEDLLAGLPEAVPAVVVDNSGDVDGVRGFCERRARTRYLDAGGVGFARAANLGAATSGFPLVVFVNPDTRPTIGTLRSVVGDVRSDPGLLSSSPLNVGPGGAPELGAAGWEPTLGRALAHAVALHKLLPRTSYVARPRRNERVAVDWVTGSCMAVDRARFESLGGFDERYYVYNEDMALGFAARRAGLRQLLRTDITVPHAQGGSGAPSSEMVRLKGASMHRYLMHRRSRLEAAAVVGVLAAGHSGRVALFGALGRRAKAAEDVAYVRGLLTGRATVGGVVVTDRE